MKIDLLLRIEGDATGAAASLNRLTGTDIDVYPQIGLIPITQGSSLNDIVDAIEKRILASQGRIPDPDLGE